ncbi:Alpha/Beta hydrolase protein [Lactarius quietus]|nr:Alpha/Beta hydrolase protein [Lactarius quietus]
MTRLILVGLLLLLSLCRASCSTYQLSEVSQKETPRSGRTLGVSARSPITAGPPGVQNITFSNPKPPVCKFYVDGTTIPDVDFDVGPSWSGLIPISGAANETRELFFWFFPPGPEGNLDSLLFWTNGGPGCSSLEGMFQENGPFTWGYGQARPTQNQWSWTNISSVLYVEQPVGTGFSQGEPNAQNEEDAAAQLVGFLQQFLEIFLELKGKNFYLAGESYAGFYVPSFRHCELIYENTTTSTLDLNLQGIWINNPAIGWVVVQNEIPAVVSQSFLAQLDSVAETCNYADYMATSLPLPGTDTQFDEGCDVWAMIFNAALIINPAFNPYRVFDTWPILWDVLGFPGAFFQNQTPMYFDRADVKAAIHAPASVEWAECTDVQVFPNGDASLPPALTVLPNVIEKSVRSVIVHGLADFRYIAEGTRIVLQKGRYAGIPAPIANDSFIVEDVGALGTMHSERGLTYVEVALAGHMVPQFSPKILEYLFGLRDSP